MKIQCLMAAAWVALALPGCIDREAKVETEEEKTLYALGLAVGESLGPFKGQLIEEEVNLVLRGFSDAALGREPVVELSERMPQLEAMAQQRMAKAAQEQKDKGRAFLDAAAAEEGAIRTTSGLVYKELVAGVGPQPQPTDTVKIHYRGTLIDGTVFDSSVERGEPVVYPLNQFIPGWIEGVQMMKSGGKAQLVIPAELAYGDRGNPPAIPGDATLIFEIELLGIE